jgi:CheY-like chemotaxis protein
MARILIVDDDEAMRTIAKEHLLRAYEVIDTGAPETALALALEHKPDAILLDLSMPGMSGFELCQVLSSLDATRQIPIIIASGEDMRNKAFCLRLGAVSYFTKPIDFPRLRAELAEILNSKKDERRANLRVQLRVTLKLKAKQKDGTAIEVRATTENMSKGGFLCSCASSLEEGATFEVTLCGDRELSLGHARLVRVVRAAALDPRFGFQFIGTTEASDLISQLESTRKTS